MAKIDWYKADRNAFGDIVVITYRSKLYPGAVIQSYKRPIQHSNRSGSWMYTDYPVIINGEKVATKHTLEDARKTAEELWEKYTEENKNE